MSWMAEALRIFDAMGRPIDYRDISMRTNMSDNVAQKCICRLLKAGCIQFVSGSARTGRRYERVPGVPLPPDGRGGSPASRSALRARASRPTSNHTDTVCKPQ